MNTYTLKNFRVFDEKGATFNIAPLTILTGCNSSGKSSVTKSMMLINPWMAKIKEEIQSGKFGGFTGLGFADSNLDFTRSKHKLGYLERAVNWNADKKEFTIGYSTYSHSLQQNLDIELTFGAPVSSTNTQSLHAVLKSASISGDGKLFYSYKCSEMGKEGDSIQDKLQKAEWAGVNLSGWKQELIRALHNVEIAYTLDRISEDNYLADQMVGPVRFSGDEWEKAKDFFGDNANIYCYINHMIKNITPHMYEEFCKRFDFKNITGDWKNDSYKYEFPYQHILPMDKLMDELNAQDKASIEEYAIQRFIEADDVCDRWFAQEQSYRDAIRDIFTEYRDSEYTKFSDFYSHYEDAFFESNFIYFGTKGGHSRTIAEDGIYMADGTACWEVPGMNIFNSDRQWKGESDSSKFYLMFACLQGFGGYKNYSYMNGPDASFPHWDALRGLANLICSEAFAGCDMLADMQFIEIDRSNTQRIYSYSEQGTSFNSILDNYYNMADSVYYNYDSNHLNGKTYQKGTFAKKWLKELTGLEGFSLVQAMEGAGYFVYMKKKCSDGEIREIPLADLGYGTTPLISMLLRIEMTICAYLDKPCKATICIEEPESNLHPKFQSLLADMFVDAINYPVRILLETHSEYLIRKLQLLVADEIISRDKVALYYLYSPDINERKLEEIEEPQVKLIGIEKDGQLANSFGSGFFDEATNSSDRLI